MRLPAKKFILTALFFAIAIVLLILISTSRPKLKASENVTQPDTTVSNYIEEIQRKGDLERDEKEQAEKQAKLAKAKKDSVECQFWMQQQATKTTRKTEEKVKQFCEL